MTDIPRPIEASFDSHEDYIAAVRQWDRQRNLSTDQVMSESSDPELVAVLITSDGKGKPIKTAALRQILRRAAQRGGKFPVILDAR